MALCYDDMDVRLHGYVDSHWLCFHFGKWSSELGVEAAKDSRLVYDGGEYVAATETCKE